MRDDVARLRSRGFAVCRPDPKEKLPKHKGWSSASLEAKHFTADSQVGIIGGSLSNGGNPGHALVILDLDTESANRFADELLPKTGMEEGRSGKPRSHRYYLVPVTTIPHWGVSTAQAAAPAAAKATGHSGPFTKSFHERNEDGTVGRESFKFIGTGAQAVCPPSLHSASGTNREWEGGSEPGEPTVVDFMTLWTAVCDLAGACGCSIPDVIPHPYRGEVTRVPTPIRDRVIKYLAACPGAVSGANGHNETFKTCVLIVGGFDMHPGEALPLLMDHYNPKCVPQWSEVEMRHKVEDAGRVPYRKPKGWLRDAPLKNGQVATTKTSKPLAKIPAVAGGILERIDAGTADYPEELAATPSGESTPEPQPWESLIPLPGLPPVVPFPLHVFPEQLQAFVTDVAGTTNTPPDYAASFALAIAAGSIGATRACSIKDGHIQRASVYLTVVARKGSTKTPALDAVAAPIYDEQARLKISQKGKPPSERTKVFTSDVTAEKLAKQLMDNPRGMMIIRDELAGWLASFNQYKAGGKGGDRQFFLSAWSGAPVNVDRKGKDKDDDVEVFVRHPCLSVVGTIQPSVLDRFKTDGDDGFYDRVLFSYPDEYPLCGEQWKTIAPEPAKRWAEVLYSLRGIEMEEDKKNGPRPFFLHLDDAAKAGWQGWTNRVADIVNAADFDDVLRGPYVKLAGYAARFAVVIHCLRIAYGEDLQRTIDAKDMRAGADLGHYFISHAARVWAATGFDAKTGSVRKLLTWVKNCERTEFTRRDAHRLLIRSFPNVEELTHPLRILVEHCHLRYKNDATGKPAPGRPTVTYEIHPELCQRVNAVSASTRTGVPLPKLDDSPKR